MHPTTSEPARKSLEQLGEAQIEALLDQDADEEAAGRDGVLRCASCGTVICRPQDGCTAGGAHRHRCRNPLGRTFDFACYSRAEVVLLGPLSDHHSWFRGHRWQIAVCPNCRTHLGWRFRDDSANSFYALISNQLRAAT